MTVEASTASTIVLMHCMEELCYTIRATNISTPLVETSVRVAASSWDNRDVATELSGNLSSLQNRDTADTHTHIHTHRERERERERGMKVPQRLLY